MAKKKLLSYQEWQQREREKKERARLRQQALKAAKMAAFWAIPAQSNYVELSASWTGPRPCPTYYGWGVTRQQALGPDGMMVQGRVLPDKRRLGGGKLSIQITVPGNVNREEIAAKLVELATCLLASGEVWDVAAGAPLARPVAVEGIPARVVETHRYPSETTAPPVTPTPRAEAGVGAQDLQALRTDLERWLSAHRTDDSPLARLAIEQLAEVLLMQVCGQDIALVSERDPWRWEHTAEELRAAEDMLAAELHILSDVTEDLNRHLGAEAAIRILLTVFVEGR
jgi:hypothetical protein